MPHLKVALSSTAARPGRLKPLLSELAAVLGSAESIDPATVKAYVSIHENFAMNPEGPPAFAHLEIALLKGRSLELRQSIAQTLRTILATEFSEKVANEEISITVEVREMDPDTYLK